MVEIELPHRHRDWATLVRAALLRAFGAYFYISYASGNLNNYINPAYSWLVLVSAGLVTLLGLSLGARCLRGRAPGHSHAPAGAAWGRLAVLGVPLALGLLVPPQPIGASNGGGPTAAPGKPPVPEPPGRTVADWERAWLYHVYPDDFYEGKAVDLLGFVVRPAELPPADFVLGRVIMRHCAADTYSLGLLVVAPGARRLRKIAGSASRARSMSGRTTAAPCSRCRPGTSTRTSVRPSGRISIRRTLCRCIDPRASLTTRRVLALTLIAVLVAGCGPAPLPPTASPAAPATLAPAPTALTTATMNPLPGAPAPAPHPPTLWPPPPLPPPSRPPADPATTAPRLPTAAPSAPPPTVPAPEATPTPAPATALGPAGMRLTIAPNPDGVEPAGLLQFTLDLPDPGIAQGAPSIYGVNLTLEDAAGRPAVYAGTPGPPQYLYETAQPGQWAGDLSAPTTPGTYHVHLLLHLASGGTQAVHLLAPAVRVAPPATVLRNGFAYAREGNLWLTASDGSRTRKLTFNAPAVQQAAEPAWAPDGGRLAYSRSLPAPQDQVPGWEIWSLRPDGSGDGPLVRRQAGEYLHFPVWTPDGHLLITVDRSINPSTGAPPASPFDPTVEQWSIDQVDLAAGTHHLLLADASMGDVSADGRQLVYLGLGADPTTGGQILTTTLLLTSLAAPGGRPRVLVAGSQFQALSGPRFSPDGRLIAFAAPNPQGWGNPGGWLPDLAPVARANGVPWEVYVVDTAGGPPRQLTHLQADQPAVAWTADSRTLAILSDAGLFLQPLDGSPARRLAPGANHGYLSWHDAPGGSR